MINKDNAKDVKGVVLVGEHGEIIDTIMFNEGLSETAVNAVVQVDCKELGTLTLGSATNKGVLKMATSLVKVLANQTERSELEVINDVIGLIVMNSDKDELSSMMDFMMKSMME